jgi:hypothetical protein
MGINHATHKSSYLTLTHLGGIHYTITLKLTHNVKDEGCHINIRKSNYMHYKIHVMHMRYYIFNFLSSLKFLKSPTAPLLHLDSDTTLGFRFS